MKVDQTTLQSGNTDAQYEFEKVEYGKYCVSRDGPIEKGVEHARLAATKNFPPDLLERCTPDGLSLAESAAELDRERVLTADRPYGTVIRPVRLNGKCEGLIAFRVGIRPEAGQGSRFYRAARYLYDGSGSASPFTLYSALGKFEGFARADASEQEPVRFRETVPSHDVSRASAFLGKALIYAVSAVPIQVDAVAEGDFFYLADLLWRQLPTESRKLFSAGWNVARVFNGTFSMSYAANASVLAEAFDFPRNIWPKPPNRENDLVPGDFYAMAHLKSGELPPKTPAELESILARLDQPKRRTENSSAEIRKSFQGLEFPGLSDPATKEKIRKAGEVEFDAVVLNLLNQWLTVGSADLPVGLGKAVDRLFLEDQGSVLELLRRTFHDGEQGRRGDQLVSRCLSQDPDKETFAGDDWLDFPRRRFVAAARAGDIDALMTSWAELSGSGENYDLYREVKHRLGLLFHRSLDFRYVDNHLQMFSLTPSPAHYLDLVREHAERAALFWVQIDDHGKAVNLITSLCAALSQISVVECTLENSKILEAKRTLAEGLRRFLVADAPTVLDREWVGHLAETDNIVLRKTLERLWSWERQKQPLEASRLSGFLSWSGIFKTSPISSPELQLAAGCDVTVAQIAEIVSRGLHLVIPELYAKLIEVVPAHATSLTTEIAQNWAQWAFAVEALPMFEKWILFGYANRPQQWAESPEETPHSLTERQLSSLLHSWLYAAPTDVPTRDKAIAHLCRLCGELAPTSDMEPLVNAIRDVLQGKWTVPDYEMVEIDAAVQILRSPGVKLPEQCAKRLFLHAKRGWHLRLSYELFNLPNSETTLTPNHWNLLVKERRWLRTVESDQFRAAVAPALCECYDPDLGVKPSGWKEEYARSVLWAAFGQTPGTPSEAVEAYGMSEREKISCYRSMLRTYRGTNSEKLIQDSALAFIGKALTPFNKDQIVVFLACWEKGGPASLYKTACHLRIDRRETATIRHINDSIYAPEPLVNLLQDLAESLPRKDIVSQVKKKANL